MTLKAFYSFLFMKRLGNWRFIVSYLKNFIFLKMREQLVILQKPENNGICMYVCMSLRPVCTITYVNEETWKLFVSFLSGDLYLFNFYRSQYVFGRKKFENFKLYARARVCKVERLQRLESL